MTISRRVTMVNTIYLSDCEKCEIIELIHILQNIKDIEMPWHSGSIDTDETGNMCLRLNCLLDKEFQLSKGAIND